VKLVIPAKVHIVGKPHSEGTRTLKLGSGELGSNLICPVTHSDEHMFQYEI